MEQQETAVSAKVEIKHRWSGAVLFEFAGVSIKLALEAAVEAKVDLRGAYLSGAYLRGAYLSGANLSDANLSGAYLSGAYLRGAYLSGANLSDANLSGANLSDANLSDANLSGANLSDANLSGANLRDAKEIVDSTVLPTGETFAEYKREVVPALCTAGGKTLEEVAAAWDCHDWSNCPMRVAFGINTPHEAPAIWRHRVEQFVQLFDANLIPRPETVTASDPVSVV